MQKGHAFFAGELARDASLREFQEFVKRRAGNTFVQTRRVVTRGGNCFAIGTKGGVGDDIAVPAQNFNKLARRGFPYACGVIIARGEDKTSVGTERGACDFGSMSLKFVQELAAVRVPHARRFVIVGRQEVFAVRTVRDA